MPLVAMGVLASVNSQALNVLNGSVFSPNIKVLLQCKNVLNDITKSYNIWTVLIVTFFNVRMF